MFRNHSVNGGGGSSIATSMTPLTKVRVSLIPATRNNPEDAPEPRPIESPDFTMGQYTVIASCQKARDENEKGERCNRKAIGDRVMVPSHNIRVIEQMPESDNV